MPSGAARLPVAAAVRAEGGGVVTAEPSWVTERRRCGNPGGGWASPAGRRRGRGRQGCPDAGHAIRRSVRVRCPPADVCPLVGRTSGVHASGVHATGAILVSGRTRLRCLRPLHPGCRHRAGSWNASVRRGRPGLGASGSTCRCVCERLGRRCPNRAWRGRDGRGLAVRGSHQGRRQTAAAAHAYRLRRRARRLADQGSWSQGQVPVGWLGARGRSRCSQVPPGVPWAGCRVMAGHGAGSGRW